MPSTLCGRLAASVPSLVLAFACSTALMAQQAPPPSHTEFVQVASGVLANALPIETVVWQDFVTVPAGTPWLRLQYAAANLDQGSYLRIVSLRDGEVMTMHQEHLAQWGMTSAFFNGNSVLVQLVAGPHTVGNEVTITRVTAGDAAPDIVPETICGSTDDRVPSSDPRSGRLSNGCSGWIIDAAGGGNQKLHLSAGHCYAASGAVLQFAVPSSSANCSLVQPPVAKQFAVDASTSQYVNGGVGNDYWVFRCFANSTTGLTTFQEQGAAYTLATAMPSSGSTVRNTGYGVDGTNTNGAAAGSSCSCTSSAGTGTRNQTQQTHTGNLVSNAGTTLQHQVDTCGGNSGSVLIDEVSGRAIGIHTHGGCSTGASTYNSGTQVTHPSLVAAIQAMCPTCAVHASYGTSCSTARSFYELFAAAGSDLAGKTVVLTPNAGGGYDVSVVPLTTFRTPTGAGLALTDDVVSAAQSLPFTFQYPGGSTSSFCVDSNGRVLLASSGTSAVTPSGSGLVGNAAAVIAACWADLLPDGTTNARNVFVHTPVAGETCITWNNVPFYGVAGAVTVQVALIDNGTSDRVEIRCSAHSTPDLAHLVGFSPGSGSVDPGSRDLTAGAFSTSADAAMLTLTAAPAPVLGANVTYTVSNVRANASLTQILVNFASIAPTPLSTIGLNAPGCMLNLPSTSQSFGPLLFTNPAANVGFVMPTGASWIGVDLFLQAFELAPAANPAGVISSNGLRSRISNQWRPRGYILSPIGRKPASCRICWPVGPSASARKAAAACGCGASRAAEME